MTVRLLLSCGEPSGDLYAGALTRELRALSSGLEIAGMGGPQFAAAGGHVIADYRGLAVTGLTEAIAKVPRSLGTIRTLVASARDQRPDALVVIDFPDFNFPLARRIKKLGVPVVYYITPQIWAWRSGRLKTIRKVADRALVIFPFEEAIYQQGGVPVQFVGHPLVDLAQPSAGRSVFLGNLGLSRDAPTVAILPGSRPNEVSRILPDLVAAARLIRRQVDRAQFVFARAPNLDDRLFETARKLSDPPDRLGPDSAPGASSRSRGIASHEGGQGFGGPPERQRNRKADTKAEHGSEGVLGTSKLSNPSERGYDASGGSHPWSAIVEGDTDTVLASADVALTASGTATVQAALHDTPMVVVYRLSALTYRLGRPLMKVDTFAMVNLIAGERVVPELIQDAFTPEAVATEALSMLTDAARAARIREALARVRVRLGGPGASRRAAEAILQVAGKPCDRLS